MAKIKFKYWKSGIHCCKIANGFRILGVSFWKTSSEIGKSRGMVQCPCCGAVTEIYIWSFGGCGKRCCHCNVMLGKSGAYFDKSEINSDIVILDDGNVTIVQVENSHNQQ